MKETTTSAYRARLKQKGLVRVELHVRRGDAGLLRAVADALADPRREAEAREILQRQVVGKPLGSLKDLLAAAPIDGIEFDRPRDFGRETAL